MRFGQSLFAGSSAAGFITAAGVALCLSSAVGGQEVHRYAAGIAPGVATATATSSRLIEAEAVALDATAAADGRPVVNFTVSGLVHALATASGYSQGYLFGRGAAYGLANALGIPLKSTRQYPYHASCFATATGDGVVWDIAVPAPALASATGLGTTWYLGYGSVVGTASIYGIARQQAGGAGAAVGTAECEGAALYTLGARNTAYGRALLSGDAAVTRSGTRYFEALGDGEAVAEAKITTTSVYQSQSATATARAEARGGYTIGLAGHGYGIAQATGEALAASTTVTGVPGYVYAYASGKAQFTFGGAGLASPTAKAVMSKQPVVTNTKANPGPVQAKATVTGGAKRALYAKGQSTSTAMATGKSSKALVTKGSAKAYAQASLTRIAIAVRGAYLNASATGQGSVTLIKLVSGRAVAYALGEGYNQINDLARAPADRTLYVDFVERLYELEAQDRLLTV